MGLVAEPYTLIPGQPARASEVMANLIAILNAVNGGIDGDNAVTGTAVPTGPSSSAGSGTDLILANHTHAVQGHEALSADPSTGNFVGREYFNTATLEKRLCIATGGSGTWITTGNPTATELVVHAAQHATGGHDPLPDGVVAMNMRGSQTPAAATQASDVLLPVSTWTTIVDLSVTTVGVQTLLVMLHNFIANSSGSAQPGVYFRVQDHTAADVTIFRSERTRLDTTSNSAGGSDRTVTAYTFPYSVPSGGARTLRLQAWCGVNNVVTVTTPTASTTGDSFVEPNIQAVIL